jgi:hypothetical protein
VAFRGDDEKDVVASNSTSTSTEGSTTDGGDGTTTSTIPGIPDDLTDLLDDFGGDTGGAGAGGMDIFSQCSGPLSSALLDSFEGGGAGEAVPPGDLVAEVQAIARNDEEIRGLAFDAIPEPEVLSAEAMNQRVQDMVEAQYSDDQAAEDSVVLIGLGAVPEGTDMKQLQMEALGGQVAGFYDPKTGKIVMGEFGSGEGLSTTAKITMAHELDHALTDQALGLPDLVVESHPGQEDATLGALGLIEGDATLVMYLALFNGFGQGGDPFSSMLDMGGEDAAATQALLDALPVYIQKSLLYPYTDGLAFVCALHDQGGFAAVDAAYDNPPATSAQVLFPERYFAGEEAVAAASPGQPGSGWDALPVRQLGAAELEWLLAAPGGDASAALDNTRARVEAWAGGSLTTWTNGGETAVAISLVEHEGFDTLCDTMTQWAEASNFDATTVSCNGDDVVVGIAPDQATADAIAG